MKDLTAYTQQENDTVKNIRANNSQLESQIIELKDKNVSLERNMNKKYDETVNDLTSELKYVQNQLNEKEILLKKADQ